MENVGMNHPKLRAIRQPASIRLLLAQMAYQGARQFTHTPLPQAPCLKTFITALPEHLETSYCSLPG
jgi:hypothetical protein